MKIIKYKNKLISAGLMIVLSTGPIVASCYYNPVAASLIAEPAEAAVLRQQIPVVSTQSNALMAVSSADTDDWQPTPGYLNLIHYFPEGADQTKKEESYAGQAFKTLMERDADWLNEIYNYADMTPLQLAERLGQSAGSVTGKYNPRDSRHNPDDSATWTINSFKKIRMTVTNGDGQAVSAHSNVVDIMSMANLYSYFNDVNDYDLFLSYAENLWEHSHSHSVSMSGLYYCQGCLSEADDLRELAELEAEALQEEQALAQLAEERQTAEAGNTSAGTVAAEEESSTSAVIEAGTVKKEPETTAAETAETEPESTAGVITAGGTRSQTETETSSETAGTMETAETATAAATEITPAALPGAASASNADSSLSEQTDAAPDTSPSVSYHCPGHVDLIVNVKILGLNETNGLLAQDTIGNNPDNIKENGWPGWNNYTIASAKLHSSQDWFEKYGLTVSVFSMNNPLTESEIEAYMQMLPKDLSQERIDLIHYALSSVGKVPYYWGGKASAPSYSANSFGIMITPDEKGRVLKGLDCSGWINWVYWSSTGKRLPYESTSGLAVVGTRISRDELLPGDIVIRTGTDAHVIMFLGWTEDGRILCIHESSGKVNNVTVAVRDANWPYYRRLID